MKKNILKLSISFLVILIFTGCLKDKGFDNAQYQLNQYSEVNQKVISIGLSTDGRDSLEQNVSIKSIFAGSSVVTVNLIPITISGGIPAAQDVHIVIDTVDLLRTQYNDYVPPNSNAAPAAVNHFENPALVPGFSLVSKTVTIPAGQTTGYVQVRLKPDDFLGNAYGLGIKIISVDNGYLVATNRKGQGIGGFAIANEYEGDYAVDGIRYNYSTTPISYNPGDPIPVGYVSTTAIPNPKHISTINSTTVYIDFANLGAPPNSFAYVVQIPPGLSGNTNYPVTTTLNPAAAAANSLIDFKVHTYNPATKTFKFVVVYNNAAGGTGSWRLLLETLKKI